MTNGSKSFPKSDQGRLLMEVKVPSTHPSSSQTHWDHLQFSRRTEPEAPSPGPQLRRGENSLSTFASSFWTFNVIFTPHCPGTTCNNLRAQHRALHTQHGSARVGLRTFGVWFRYKLHTTEKNAQYFSFLELPFPRVKKQAEKRREKKRNDAVHFGWKRTSKSWSPTIPKL